MCAFIFTTSLLKICAPPPACSYCKYYFSSRPKSVSRETKSFSNTRENTNFLGDFGPPFFLFFAAWLSAYQNRGNEREYLFSVSNTSAYRHFSHRDTLLCSTIRTYTRTQHNTYKMFSMTQSASFCATKVNVAAQKKQQSKIKRSSIQAKAIISSESLSKRDFLSAAVLSFGFLSVGDANAATKRVRKTSSSAAPVTKSPAATKKSAAKPAYKPKGKTVVPAPSVATSPASRRGRRGVPIAGKSSSVSGGKRKNRSPAQARKGKY